MTKQLFKYCNGFLLLDKTYYNNCYWLDDMNGWYFLDSVNLINNGYKIYGTIDINYDNYNLNQLELYLYKNGFILKPTTNFKYYKQQYLWGGIWDKVHNGWFFDNIIYYNTLIKLGINDIDLNNLE